jgi:uncharacterized protein YegL
MLKSLITPLLIALCIGSGSYYYRSDKASQPANLTTAALQVTPTPLGQPNALPAPATQALPPSKLPDVDAILVIDNSGSMFGYTCVNHTPRAANDRDQIRIRGADIIIGALAADLKPRETKLGIVTFGDQATLTRQLTQLSNDDSSIRSDLSQAIQNPPCQGDTNIVAAIREAQQELRSERATPGNTPAIIFLTDGAPTSGGGMPEISALLDTLGDVQFFTVILGQDPELEESKSFWRDQAAKRANVKFYPIMSSDEIPALYKGITAQLNKVPALANAPTLPPGQRVEITVPANVEQLVLTVIKRLPSTPLQIQNPTGQDARAMPPEHFRSLINNSPIEVFVIERPEAGTWFVIAPPDEMVTVLQPEFKSVYQVQIVQPDAASLLATDQATNMIIQVMDVGTQLPLQGTFTISGSFRLKDEAETANRPLTWRANTNTSQYIAQLPSGTFLDGQQYIFTFNVEDAAGLRSQPISYILAAGRMPLLVSFVAAPAQAYVDQPINLLVKVTNADSASGTPTVKLLTTLPGATAPVFASSDATSYQATLPPFARPGTYTLDVAFAGKTSNGRDFSWTRTSMVIVAERASTIWLRRLALVVAVLSGMYLIFRYLLLGMLIPLFQTMRISPEGYVRVIPPGQTYPNGEIRLRDLLRRRRKLRKLSVGVGSGFDIPLDPDPKMLVDDENTPPKRPSLRDRLWGKKAAGYVRKKGGDTIIEHGPSSRTFSTGAKNLVIEESTIEFSLKSLDNPDADGNP